MNPLPIVALLLFSQRSSAAPARILSHQSVEEVREGLHRAVDILEKIERFQQMAGTLSSGRALPKGPEAFSYEDRDPYVMSPMPPRQYQDAEIQNSVPLRAAPEMGNYGKNNSAVDGISPDLLQMMQTFGPLLKTLMQNREG